jgi:double-stranded uracil-DNA glycosylase
VSAVSSFPPVLNEHTHTLILGSMPGIASLNAQQYYAHPRNAFWPLLGELLGFDPLLPYPARLAALLERGVGLWDVLANCERVGSLDTAIDARTMQFNALPDLLQTHPRVQRMLTNGASASKLFQRQLLPKLLILRPQMRWFALPSTSPANAGQSYADKRAAWAKAFAEPYAGACV